MPIIKSAKKALRRDRRRGVINAKLRRRMKQALKAAKKNATAKNLAEAYRLVDRAAKKRVIHKNKAARLKSRLTIQLKGIKVTKVSKVIKVKKIASRPKKKPVKKSRKRKSIKA